MKLTSHLNLIIGPYPRYGCFRRYCLPMMMSRKTVMGAIPMNPGNCFPMNGALRCLAVEQDVMESRSAVSL